MSGAGVGAPGPRPPNATATIIPTYHTISLASNGSQRRRHPASNQNTTSANQQSQSSQLFSNLAGLFGGVAPPPPATTTRPGAAPAAANSRESFLTNLLNLSGDQTAAAPNNNVGLGMLREIFTVVNSNNPNDERLQRPVSELLNSFGINEENEEATSGTAATPRSALWHLFNIVFSSMNLSDMLSLATAQNLNQVFAQSQTQLRTYVQNTFQGQSENEIINKLYEDIVAELNVNFGDFELLDNNIDLSQSVERLVKDHLRIMFQHILNGTGDSWGTSFYQKIITFRDQIVALMRTCVKDANVKICDIVCAQLEGTIISPTASASLNQNDFFRNTFRSFIRTQLVDIIGNTSTNNDSIRNYVVLKSDVPPPPPLEPIEIDEEEERLDDEEENLVDLASPVNHRHTSDNTPSNLQHIPNEWLSTVYRDIQTQNDTNRDYNFSTAYASGMLSKRRKYTKRQSETPLNSFFNTVMRRTLNQINGSEEQRVQHQSSDSNLISAFDSQIDEMLRERVTRDASSDANNKRNATPENYPTTDRYRCCFSAHKRLHNLNDSEKFPFTKKRMMKE